MLELISNLQMPYPYSDGTVSRKEIATAAMKVELDVVMVTDHTMRNSGIIYIT
jgi:predicted metal-dependent phosphoesterase TrpH